MNYKPRNDKFLVALATDLERETERVSRGERCDVCNVLGCIPLRHSLTEQPLSDEHARTFARNLLARPGVESGRTLLLAHHIATQNPTRPPGTEQCRALAIQVHACGNSCVLEVGHEGDHRTWRNETFTRAASVKHGYELEGAIAKLCGCEKHKRYRAARKPSGNCEGCWRLWILIHPNFDLETRWRR